MTPKKLNVLIVDDSGNNRMVLDVYLDDFAKTKEGAVEFDITHAKDGQEAMTMAIDHDYDVILMDIMMPVMDGVEATRAILNAKPDSVVVAVSASDSVDMKGSMLKHGAKQIIEKPIKLEELYTFLETLL